MVWVNYQYYTEDNQHYNKESVWVDSRFDIDGRVAEADNTALKSHIITDRGIYRPGEMLHTAIITKPADWNVKLSNIPLQVEISTPSGQVAHKDTIRLAKNGLM